MKDEIDIADGLDEALEVNVGDSVYNASGDRGEVLGYSSEGLLVVLFDRDGEKIVATNMIMKSGKEFTRPGHSREVKKKEFSIPLRHALKMGFVHLAFGMYEWKRPKTAKLKRYPWDKYDGFWKVMETDGKKMLVKDDAFNGDSKKEHQLDEDGGSSPGFSSGEFNIF
jgi:hypothetical protein